jgi:ABC transport system ATP-binding/permease protein
MTSPLVTRALSKAFAKPLFESLSFSLEEGEKVGLVGPNGVGKSTLLKIVAGLEDADEGEVITVARSTIGYLPQRENHLLQFSSVHEALSGSYHLSDLTRTQAVATWESKCGFNAPSNTPASLSGGWRKRLSLGCVLINEPSLLLLDEPTNHLDFEGIAWCESILARYRGTLLVSTHDRAFLKAVCSRIIELNPFYPQGFFSCRGDYDTFLEKRSEFVESITQQAESLSNKVQRDIAFLRSGVKARTTKSSVRIQQAHERIELLQRTKERARSLQKATLEFQASGRKTRDLVNVQHASFAFPDGRELFRDLSFLLKPGECLGILGRNGSGKSTLLQIIGGSLQPTRGKVVRAGNLSVIHFTQQKDVDLSLTLKEFLAPEGDSVVFNGISLHVAGWASRFLFSYDHLRAPLHSLSGGELSRAVLARLMLTKADILLLDEPTNDLDIPTLEVLESCIEEFPGAVVLISHDRAFLEATATSLLALDGTGRHQFGASLTQLLSFTSPPEAKKNSILTPRVHPSPEVSQKKLSFKEQKELQELPARIETLEEEQKSLEHTLSLPSTDSPQRRDMALRLSEVLTKIESLYARWEELDE